MREESVAAEGCFADGYNCAQSVLRVWSGRYGLDEVTAVRLATGFGVGMSRGGICGAVSGAVMVLGLAGGGGGPDEGAAKAATYVRVRDYYSRFIDRHGSCICRDLLGLDPSTPQGLALARREKLFESVCLGLVRDAAALLREFLAEIPAVGRS